MGDVKTVSDFQYENEFISVMCAGVDSRDSKDHQGHHRTQPPLQVSSDT